ncbi:hypothetical protein [Paenibacillus sp. SYP-B4298]|uniref:hypothetical protein n=1 Tax=Paenibacillus sp. SYP-B4298 TaxID=2996034 RepID=UPI0022DE6D04|nr:hypothetical protein [Paenibacillus sp. SYP-B4298]
MVTQLKNKKGIMAVGILCVAILLLFYYNSEMNSGQNVSQHYSTTITADRATFGDLKGLVGISDFVVSGHYEDQIQTVRNTNESGTYYSEGNTYRFVVEDNLLGSTPAAIEVYIPHFSRHTATVHEIAFQADIDEPHYLEPDPNKQYVLFLKKVPGTDIYSPSSAPFQIEIEADRSVQLMYNMADLNKTIKANNGDSMLFIAEPLHIDDRISGLKFDVVLEQIKSEVVTKIEG